MCNSKLRYTAWAPSEMTALCYRHHPGANHWTPLAPLLVTYYTPWEDYSNMYTRNVTKVLLSKELVSFNALIQQPSHIETQTNKTLSLFHKTSNLVWGSHTVPITVP